MSGSRLGLAMARWSWSWLGWLAGIGGIVLGTPVRCWRRLRGALTPASVTLILFGIVSVNIIWGYPWIGIFSACASLLAVGLMLNRWLQPGLRAEPRLPRSAAAGSPIPTVIRLRNLGRVPAMDLQIGIAADADHGWLEDRLQRRGQLATADSQLGEQSRILKPRVSLIPPAGQIDLPAQLCCQRRGLHAPPALVVTSWFPFHLFRHTRRLNPGGEIAITPRLLSADDHPDASQLLNALGNWTRRLFAGDAMDYTGSREYESGISVRRWDFASWARLGKPIIREFESPAMPTVSFIIDTAVTPESAVGPETASCRLERLLSLAATAIDQVSRRAVHIRMFVTGEPETEGGPQASDRESLLIRLAACQQMDVASADREMDRLLDAGGEVPLLLLTSRRQIPAMWSRWRRVTVLNLEGELTAATGERVAARIEPVAMR